MLNKNGQSRHSCLIPDPRVKAFSFLPLNMMLAVGLSHMVIILLRYIPSMPTFWTIYHKWMLDTVKSSFCIYWDDHMVFIFPFVDVMYHNDWFADIEKSLHPLELSHLIMVCDLLNVLLDSVCYYFAEDFCISAHQWYWPVIFFVISLVLVSGWWWSHRMSLGILLHQQFFGRTSVNSSRNVW